jgi:hypothetical protein
MTFEEYYLGTCTENSLLGKDIRNFHNQFPYSQSLMKYMPTTIDPNKLPSHHLLKCVNHNGFTIAQIAMMYCNMPKSVIDKYFPDLTEEEQDIYEKYVLKTKVTGPIHLKTYEYSDDEKDDDEKDKKDENSLKYLSQSRFAQSPPPFSSVCIYHSHAPRRHSPTPVQKIETVERTGFLKTFGDLPKHCYYLTNHLFGASNIQLRRIIEEKLNETKLLGESDNFKTFTEFVANWSEKPASEKELEEIKSNEESIDYIYNAFICDVLSK